MNTKTLEPKTNTQDTNGSYITPDGKAQIDFGITYHNGYPEFTASGHFNGASGQCLEEIRAAYPEDHKVALLYDLWMRFHLKNMSEKPIMCRTITFLVGNHPARDFYDAQAQNFLTRNGLTLRVTPAKQQTAPPWAKAGERHGRCYTVTVRRIHFIDRVRSSFSLSFPFWGSIKDAEQGKAPTAYSVLACISGDANTPGSFADFCDESGYDSDSITARATWKRCHAFAVRLRAFFTEAEIEQLQEIN